jgi:hypothetical protein
MPADVKSQFTSAIVFTFNASTLPSGLEVARHTVGEEASNSVYAREYTAQNVYLRDGLLNLLVPGGQTESPNPARFSPNLRRPSRYSRDLFWLLFLPRRQQ